jgi:ribonuclease J
VIFDGRSIETSTQIARDLGYLRLPDGIEMNIRQMDEVPDDEVVVVTTGSQGEPMSSLARMATGSNKMIKTRPGDTIILSSKFIPGNERAITSIINHFYEQGADVVYEKISDIHVSGHAFREELIEMMQMVNPTYFIPVHGERRHLIHHARLARQAGIPEENIILPDNGLVIEFDETGVRTKDHITTGRVLVDGKGVGDVGSSVLRERKELAEDGIVVVVIVFDEETGIVVHGPELLSRGFVFQNLKGHILEDAQCVILEILEEVRPDMPDRVSVIETQMKSALRQYFKFTIKRRPVVIPVMIEV